MEQRATRGLWEKGDLVLLAMAVAFAALLPVVTHNSFLIFNATMILVFAIVGLGLGIVYGYNGQFSIGQSGFFAIGAYTTVILITHHFDLSLALLFALVLTGLVGSALAIISMRLKGYGLGIVTYGFAVIVYSLVLFFSSLTGGVNGLPVPKVTSIGINLSGPIPVYVVTLLGAIGFGLTTHYIMRSRYGRSLLVIKGNELVAGVLGIPVTTYKVGAVTFSAIAAGFAGTMFVLASDYIAAPAFEPVLSVTFFAMVLIGGARSITGIFVGSAFITVLPIVLQKFHTLTPIVFGLLVVFVMMFAEEGLIGLLRFRRL